MFSKQKLEQMKQLLLESKKTLEADLADISERNPKRAGKLTPIYPESGSNSEDDNAGEITDFANELPLFEELETQLRDVEKSLTAIEQGKYGICKYCGKEIDIKRLEARPSSSSCISCKKVLTQEM